MIPVMEPVLLPPEATAQPCVMLYLPKQSKKARPFWATHTMTHG